ncbi:MAG: hypothetical protein RL885_12245 [Planctomycetota bacterium]
MSLTQLGILGLLLLCTPVQAQEKGARQGEIVRVNASQGSFEIRSKNNGSVKILVAGQEITLNGEASRLQALQAGDQVVAKGTWKMRGEVLQAGEAIRVKRQKAAERPSWSGKITTIQHDRAFVMQDEKGRNIAVVLRNPDGLHENGQKLAKLTTSRERQARVVGQLEKLKDGSEVVMADEVFLGSESSASASAIPAGAIVGKITTIQHDRAFVMQDDKGRNITVVLRNSDGLSRGGQKVARLTGSGARTAAVVGQFDKLKDGSEVLMADRVILDPDQKSASASAIPAGAIVGKITTIQHDRAFVMQDDQGLDITVVIRNTDGLSRGGQKVDRLSGSGARTAAVVGQFEKLKDGSEVLMADRVILDPKN